MVYAYQGLLNLKILTFISLHVFEPELQRPIFVPAKSSQPRETNHLRMPMVQRRVKAL